MRAVLTYKKQRITFIKADNTVYVNGTEMGFVLGRVPAEYLRRGATKEYVIVLEKTNPAIPQLITEKPNGHNAGTRLQKDIALGFAEWLSPTFKEWLTNALLELMPVHKPKKTANRKAEKPAPVKSPVVKLTYQISYEIKNVYTA